MKEIVLTMSELVRSLDKEIRSYEHDGSFYVFRDVVIGDKRTRSQYGVLDNTKSDKSVIWADCEDGTLFEQVTPFAAKDSMYRWLAPDCLTEEPKRYNIRSY